MSRTQGISTFTGQVTIHTPVAIITKNLFPSRFTSGTGSRLIFDVAGGVLSHLINGRSRDFARITQRHVRKLTHGWRDTAGDYIVALLFPELWNRFAEKSGLDLSDYGSHYIFSGIAKQFQEESFTNVKLTLRPHA